MVYCDRESGFFKGLLQVHGRDVCGRFVCSANDYRTVVAGQPIQARYGRLQVLAAIDATSTQDQVTDPLRQRHARQGALDLDVGCALPKGPVVELVETVEPTPCVEGRLHIQDPRAHRKHARDLPQLEPHGAVSRAAQTPRAQQQHARTIVARRAECPPPPAAARTADCVAGPADLSSELLEHPSATALTGDAFQRILQGHGVLSHTSAARRLALPALSADDVLSGASTKSEA